MRAIREIIEGEQEPTEEERLAIDAVLAKWHEERFQRAEEYGKQPDHSGYILRTIIEQPKATIDELRQRWRLLLQNFPSDFQSSLEQLAAAIKKELG